MFYRLKNDYILRGWKLLPSCVINRDTMDYKFLPIKKFSVLKLCNGQNELFDDEQRKILEELLSEGYIEEKNTPSPLEDVQKYKFYDNRFMYSAHWSITGKCNCKCRHCYMSAPQHKVEEFTYKQCLDIISQMEQCGVQKITLTGGEPLVRNDFWEIVDALTAANIKIDKIYSNGMLINEKFLSELEKRNLKPDFQISFDGVNGCHDYLRGIEGAEKLTLRAIKLLSEKNLNLNCAYGLHRGNLEVLRDTVKKLGYLGVKVLRVAPISAFGEAFGMKNQILTAEEAFNFCLNYIPQYIADGAPIQLGLMGVFGGISTNEYAIPFAKAYEDTNCDKNCVCGLARTSIHIDFEGFMMPCAPMSYNKNYKKLFSTIFDKKLRDLLNDNDYISIINARLGDYFKKNPQCAACEYKNRCSSGCRGLALSENANGDFLAVDNWTCKFFKGGFYDKVLAIGEKLNLKYIGA